MQPTDSPSQALARRLRTLRKRHWPDVRITQRALAEAFGARRSTSVPLVSSWENPLDPVLPPVERLSAYALFFATRRSVEVTPFRLLEEEELTAEERSIRDDLEEQLLDMRAAAAPAQAWPTRDLGRGAAGSDESPAQGPWHFPDGRAITVICGLLPADLRSPLADPADPNYTELYTYADTDALLELFGHLRALNPASELTVRNAGNLEPDDYTAHLVVLGNGDGNPAAHDLLIRTDAPVTQIAQGPGPHGGCFEVRRGDQIKQFRAAFKPADRFIAQLDDEMTGSAPEDDEVLAEDVALFLRTINPHNRKRTLTLCSGLYSRGTLGAVRALTDRRFRDRNARHVDKHVSDAENYSILMRVSVLDGKVVTPDWTERETLLDQWP